MRSFDSLSEREILALAVTLEEEDERVYSDFADGFREIYPATAEAFEVSAMELETRRFYEKAAARAQDVSVRQLLDELALEERTHEERADELERDQDHWTGPTEHKIPASLCEILRAVSVAPSAPTRLAAESSTDCPEKSETGSAA